MGSDQTIAAVPRESIFTWDHQHAAEPVREVAMEALFLRSYTPMCRLAALILRDADAAEQVVMDALTGTLARWGSLRDEARVDAYLRRAVVHSARTALRRRHTEGSANRAYVTRTGPLRSTYERSPADTVDREPVLRAIAALPYRQRAAVVLFYYEDLPEHEIADLLGCALGTVKSQLSKARATLGRSLRAEGFEL